MGKVCYLRGGAEACRAIEHLQDSQSVKNPLSVQESQDHPWGREDAPQKGMTPPSSILAWKNPMEREAWRATVPGVASVSGAGRHRRGRVEESTANAKKTLVSSPESRWRPLLTTFSVVNVAQSCPTRCDPVDYAVGGILQARILERVAFPLPRGSSQPRD